MTTIYTYNNKVLKNSSNDKWLKAPPAPPAYTLKLYGNDTTMAHMYVRGVNPTVESSYCNSLGLEETQESFLEHLNESYGYGAGIDMYNSNWYATLTFAPVALSSISFEMRQESRHTFSYEITNADTHEVVSSGNIQGTTSWTTYTLSLT